MKGEHVHGPNCGHTFFRGRWYNTPHVNPSWTPAEIWLSGYLMALKRFRRDIRAGGERARRQMQARAQRITWSGNQ